MGLNLRQDMFCHYYTLIGSETFNNATKSAVAAGYSADSAHVQGCELLTNPKIRDKIDRLMSGFYDDFHAQKREKYDILWDMAKKESVSDKDKRGAIDIINKMDGSYNGMNNQTTVNVFKDLSIEELKQLVSSPDEEDD